LIISSEHSSYYGKIGKKVNKKMSFKIQNLLVKALNNNDLRKIIIVIKSIIKLHKTSILF